MRNLEGTDLWVARNGIVYQKQQSPRWNHKEEKPYYVHRMVKVGKFNSGGQFESLPGLVPPPSLPDVSSGGDLGSGNPL